MAQHETPQWLLPYPDSDETADVPRDLQALATTTDEAITAAAQNSGVPIGAILMWCSEFAPIRYLSCDGSSHPRADFPALSDVIESRYGGDVTNFNVPDLQSRIPLGVGSGAGLTLRTLNDKAGQERHVLTAPELPQHAHSFTDFQPYRSGTADVTVGAKSNYDGVQSLTGHTYQMDGTYGQGHENMPPFLVVHFIIRYT